MLIEPYEQCKLSVEVMLTDINICFCIPLYVSSFNFVRVAPLELEFRLHYHKVTYDINLWFSELYLTYEF